MSTEPVGSGELLTPGEVAAILYVDPKTVTRWAVAGKITAIRTPGGHRRFLKSEIAALRHVADPGEGSLSLLPRPGASGSLPSSSGAAGTGRPTLVPRTGEDPARHLDADAAAVIAGAAATARDAQAAMVAEDVAVVARAVSQAADRASAAAETARERRALAASLAAEAVAKNAAETATAMQRRADVARARLAEAAARAAEVVAEARAPGNERQDALTAFRLAATVKAAAVLTAEETAAAAVSVATSVAAAAVDVASIVSAADLAIASEVARTAAALQIVASMTARQVAADTDERASATALTEHNAMRRVH